MHNLAKSIAASDGTTFYSKGEDIHEKTCHVSFDRTFLLSSGIPISLYKASRIRTLHLPSESRYEYAGLDESTCTAIVSSFKFIRLLDLHKMNIETIPSSIGKLWHLRYLDLSNNPIEMLPYSITRFHNLQTLRCHLDSTSHVHVLLKSAFSLFFFFFKPAFVDFSTVNSAFVYCSRTHKLHFSATFSLKMGHTVLFTYLKINLLQCF